MKLLIQIEGRKEIQVVEMKNNRCIIGRKGDLAIRDNHCSSRHAEVFLSPTNELTIRDMVSKNGTYVNSKRITQTVINEGSQVVVGHTTFTLVKVVPERKRTVPPPPQKDLCVGWPQMWDTLPQTLRPQFKEYLNETI